MVRQYRIDRFNGLEVLVCEIYRKHTYTQMEYEAFQAWKIGFSSAFDPATLDLKMFQEEFSKWLLLEHDDSETFFGLKDPIPVYEYQPSIILRGVIVENRIASLQVDYDRATLSPEVVDAVNRFYGVLDSRHWRDMVSHQLELYGSLFESFDD